MLITTIELLAEQCGGTLLAGEESATVSSLAIDSRAVRSGSVFVAFSGQKTDGHAHLVQAIERGARALVVTRALEELDEGVAERIEESGVAVIWVENTLRAIQDLATAQRNRYRCPVIGITGSTGKTTTKDLVSAVLGAKYTTVATQMNQNNELGVPLTLLSGTTETEAFVIEMGMRAKGEIARLCEIARPTMGLITNVGTSHIEFLGSIEGIAAAKAELLESLKPEDKAFINGDDAQCETLKQSTTAKVVTYGLNVRCDICAEDIELDQHSCPSFLAICEEEEPFEVKLTVPGKHNVYNALAALAVGHHCGVDTKEMARALEHAQMTKMRMEVLETARKITILNDSYNANPTSMKAALDTLESMESDGRRIAVLGGMGELGSLEQLAHFDLGKYFATLSIEKLVVVGELAKRIGDGALAGGASVEDVSFCSSVEEGSDLLERILEPHDVVLVKGSRVVGLETLVERIVDPRV